MADPVFYRAAARSRKVRNRRRKRRLLFRRIFITLSFLFFIITVTRIACYTVNAVSEIAYEAVRILATHDAFFPSASAHGTAYDGDQPTEAMLQVPFIGQENYPTGCESVTAVMALRYAGCGIGVDEFIDDCLPRGSYRVQGNAAYGDDPNKVFIGDPRSASGYGCYAPALKTAMETAAPQLEVRDLCGTPLEDLTKWLNDDTPVVVWATIDMAEPYAGSRWTLPDGSAFTWIAKEHCLLLVGYDETSYWFNDPYQNKGLTAYDRKLAEQRYEQLGMQALAIA